VNEQQRAVQKLNDSKLLSLRVQEEKATFG
jgi:hypothetical protein